MSQNHTLTLYHAHNNSLPDPGVSANRCRYPPAGTRQGYSSAHRPH